MKQEYKELLTKDLCARLPYGVKIALKNNWSYHHDNVAKNGDITIDTLKGFNDGYFNIYHDNPLDWEWYNNDIIIEDIKPYLFPLSSMTEEQRLEIETLTNGKIGIDQDSLWDLTGYGELYISTTLELIQWLYKNHFDIYRLIPKGLALDATGLNIY